MQATKEKNILADLTPEEQRKLSKKEAEKFDRENDRRYGGESELTSEEQNKIIKERDEKRRLADENAENSHLEKFTRFYSEGLVYIKELVSQGEFQGRSERTELYNLIILAKISQSLESLVSLLSKKK